MQLPCKRLKIICSVKREQEGKSSNPGIHGCVVPYKKKNLAADGIPHFICRRLCIINQ